MNGGTLRPACPACHTHALRTLRGASLRTRWVLRAKGFDTKDGQVGKVSELQWASDLGCQVDKLDVGKFQGA